MNDRQRLPPASLDARTCVNAGAPILFVPLGSTEQHGPHLPLKTDTAVAVAVAEALTERLRATGTDANAFQISRGGKAAGLISIPLRYMHTPTEVLCLDDLEAAVTILTAFILHLDENTDLTPGSGI